MGVTSVIALTSSPVACRERIAASRPAPGPRTKTSIERMPCSSAFLAVASAVVCAANGVDLRLPLKPCALGSAPAACVGPRALAAHRQAAAMPLAAIGADLGQALDVHRDLPAQVTFDEDVFRARHPIDDLAQARDLFLAQVLGALVGIDACVLDDLLGGRVADAVDVGHGDDDALGRRNVDACDSCHLVPYPCRCLCLGVLEQITRTTPLRLITLQLAHIFLTDGRTFISKFLEFARATGRWSRARHPPCLRQAAG